ncbi:MAG: signal peptidase I [Chloroflexi bacterium]|nr:signal peptidase I [Chloroflexota bacterium]MCI0576320.1 signal peptidase I [Chloroflexota bacterium]MCI0650119.1 signal peptidase I [Chloroflexota bacterium]MCI0731203.1 signal peptidase I [Chloroflexota bacterium]
MANVEPSLLAELLRETMARGQLPFLTIASNSMAPLVRRGDQIGIAPARPEELQPGDVIVVMGQGELVTHRYWGCLEQNGRRRLVTRGDRQRHFDRPVAEASLVGRVVARRRQNRLLSLSEGPGRRLNHSLAGLARLDIRLFSAPVYNEGQDNWPSLMAGGRFAAQGLPNLPTRLVRRLLYGWAALLAVAAGLASQPATGSRGVENVIF